MTDVRILTNIVPEELVEEAKVEYEKYIVNAPEERTLTLDDYTRNYVNIFVKEEKLAIKERFLEILKKEVAEIKSEINSSKWFINMEYEEEVNNSFSNMIFKDILKILFEDNIEFTSEEQLKYMLGFYFNNIRDIKKEYDFLIEVENLIKLSEESEKEIPSSLLDFYSIIKEYYYETK